MCLYTKRILNRRYLPTKKNGYVPPVCTDERLRYIDIECGECFECKKKKARQWRIRMSEEMRNNPSAIFFTGTFTDKRIEQLSKKYGIDKKNVNEIATKEVRLFLERIRQTSREKKSIKHWIVTEKGHTNTRRIHIHGIFWHPNKAGLSYLLNKCWTAGYSYQGKYVNDKTVNYIVKYMTKPDLDNPEYKGIVLCSPGLGSNYINRQDAKRNKYREYKGEHNKTDETYRFRDGSLAALPKYYKEKLYTEREREELWIQKQEEGYKFIMGEKHKVESEEDEKKWEKLIQYYRIYCIRTYKDNPRNWQTQKDERKNIKKRNYTSKEKREREQYYTKLSRSMKRKEQEFDRDIEQFKKYLEFKKMLR